MKNSDKMKALEICMNKVATVVMCPVIGVVFGTNI